MSKQRVDYNDGYLLITTKAEVTKIDPRTITMIDLCHMEDIVYQGDEEFHILYCQQSFWLIGPFIDGGLWAIDQLCADNPQIPQRRTLIEYLARKLREPGLLGLRLFPIAGLGEFPSSDLPPMSVIA